MRPFPKGLHPPKTRILRVLLWGIGAGWAALAPLQAQAQPTAAATWQELRWPALRGAELPVLRRETLLAPLRYRVLVLPGSGCAGMGAIAPRYFAGLFHAEVWVLHKPQTQVQVPMPIAPADCPLDFVQNDALSGWRDQALAGLLAWAQGRTPGQEGHFPAALPTVLVGISEGAELLPTLAPAVPNLAGLVLLSAPGIDPREAAILQAERLGQWAAWKALAHDQASTLPDSTIRQGRSLRYWRDLWHWPLEQALRESPWPIAQAWGDQDELVPAQAFQRFAVRLQGRKAPWCVLPMAGANHGLQQGDNDGVQQVWARLEQWGRAPEQGFCAPWYPKKLP